MPPEKDKSGPIDSQARVLERTLGEKFLGALPRFIYIEPTNICNLRCPICPTGKGDVSGPKGKMDMDLYRHILEGAKGNEPAHTLFLHKDGEPLLHPDIIEMVNVGKESGISNEVAFATNGVLLTPDVAEQLISAGLDEIYIGIESLDPKRYSEIRVGAEVEQVLENVNKFIEIKGGKGHGTRAVITTINLGCSAPDVMEIFHQWRDVADRVQVVERYGWAGRYNDDLIRHNDVRTNPCAGLWYLMAITWRGEVDLCCLDAGSTCPVADLSKQTIPEVWKGDEYNRLRRLHLSGRFDRIPLCEHCVDGDIEWIEKALEEI